jgi:hypothetical protein
MRSRRMAGTVLALMALGAIAPSTAVAAATTTMHFSVPISEVIRCEERVLVTGQFDFMSHTTVTSDGATLVVLRLMGDDLVSIGLESGDSYRLIGAAMEVAFEGRPVYTATFVHHGVLVGGDPGAEHPLSFAFHTTINKNQEVSVGVDKSEC